MDPTLSSPLSCYGPLTTAAEPASLLHLLRSGQHAGEDAAAAAAAVLVLLVLMLLLLLLVLTTSPLQYVTLETMSGGSLENVNGLCVDAETCEGVLPCLLPCS